MTWVYCKVPNILNTYEKSFEVGIWNHKNLKFNYENRQKKLKKDDEKHDESFFFPVDVSKK